MTAGAARGFGWTGAGIAALAFAVTWLLPLQALTPEAQRLAAILAAVVVLFVSEALPLPVTAMLGVAASVALGVAPAKEAFAPFADPLMFLFIGSFLIARAIFVNGLDRRFAFGVLSLSWVGARPSRILFAFGAVTAFLSAWMSNTATTAMMFPIGLSILAFLRSAQSESGGKLSDSYGTALMLMTAFAASIGGLATPIGTPPNLIGLGFLRQIAGIEVPFLQWVAIGAPIVVVLFLFVFFYLDRLCPAGVKEVPGAAQLLRRESEALGPWTRGQLSTVTAFAFTALLWVLPGMVAVVLGEAHAAYSGLQSRLPEGAVAVFGATLLFVLPGDGGKRALTWEQAAGIDWGVILLYGGGFALGVLSFGTGLAQALASGITGIVPGQGELGLLIASTAAAMLLSEATSNTASANMIVPVVIAVSNAAGVSPLEPALGATLGSSLGFMLPVSTPCNAIVYGSGLIPLSRMIRYGLLLDIAGVVGIVALVRLLVPWVLGR